MKKIIFFCLLSLAMQSCIAQIKVCQLPETMTGTPNDWLIKEDSSCGIGSGGTRKIKVSNFMSTYGIGSGSSLIIPLNQIVFGTGTGTTSNTSCIYDPSTGVFIIGDTLSNDFILFDPITGKIVNMSGGYFTKIDAGGTLTTNAKNISINGKSYDVDSLNHFYNGASLTDSMVPIGGGNFKHYFVWQNRLKSLTMRNDSVFGITGDGAEHFFFMLSSGGAGVDTNLAKFNLIQTDFQRSYDFASKELYFLNGFLYQLGADTIQLYSTLMTLQGQLSIHSPDSIMLYHSITHYYSQPTKEGALGQILRMTAPHTYSWTNGGGLGDTTIAITLADAQAFTSSGTAINNTWYRITDPPVPIASFFLTKGIDDGTGFITLNPHGTGYSFIGDGFCSATFSTDFTSLVEFHDNMADVELGTDGFFFTSGNCIAAYGTTYLAASSNLMSVNVVNGDGTDLILATTANNSTIDYAGFLNDTVLNCIVINTTLTFTGNGQIHKNEIWVNNVLIGSSAGTVTSVALSLPAEFSISGSPVTTLGTLAGSWNSQTQNKFFSSPNGSSGTPSFRAIVSADVPTLNQNTTGSAGSVANSLSISAELIAGGASSFNGSIAKSISIQSGSVTGSMIASGVALAGSPTTTTQSSSDNSTKISTTAFVTTAINNAIAAVNPAVAVQAATIANVSGYTYNNGASGVGATLTQNSAAVVVIDGYTLLLNDRVLFKNQSTAANNGVYSITTLGTGIIPAVFTRASDYNQPSDINNTGAIPVVNGTVNATTSWLLTSSVATVGTSAITYTQFSYAPSTIITNSTSAGGDLTGTYPNPTLSSSISNALWVANAARIYRNSGVGIGADISSTDNIFEVRKTTLGGQVYIRVDTTGNAVHLDAGITYIHNSFIASDGAGLQYNFGAGLHSFYTGGNNVLQIGGIVGGSTGDHINTTFAATDTNDLVPLRQLRDTILKYHAFVADIDTLNSGADISAISIPGTNVDGMYSVKVFMQTNTSDGSAGLESLSLSYWTPFFTLSIFQNCDLATTYDDNVQYAFNTFGLFVGNEFTFRHDSHSGGKYITIAASNNGAYGSATYDLHIHIERLK